jgi:hypothetical protein
LRLRKIPRVGHNRQFPPAGPLCPRAPLAPLPDCGVPPQGYW